MLILSARDTAKILNLDLDATRELMRLGKIKSIPRYQIAGTRAGYLVTTPYYIIEYIAEKFNIPIEEAQRTYIHLFNKKDINDV